MDCSFRKWISIGKPKTHHTRLHLAIVQHYVTFLKRVSEQELPTILITDSPNPKELRKHVFRVPHGINKHSAVKEFTSFLVRLLYHKPRFITDSCEDQIRNLEKELRFLLTVLGDTDEFESLLGEFEAVANEAGGVVLSLLFDGELMDGGCAVVLNHINLLTANIINILSHEYSVSRSSYKSHNTSVVESLLVFNLLVHDVEDLINGDDGRIADVKDQIQILHQGLLCFQPFIKDAAGSSHDQLKEYYLRIGHLAHEAQHLIVSFLAGDAPPWYLVNRLIHVNCKIELCRVELQEITMRCKFGGLEVAKHFNKQMSSSLPKRNTAGDGDIIGFEDNMTYVLDHLVGGGAQLRVISIFGMPGLGKTTLAKKLYNHPSVNYRFDRLSWCVVSQTYLKRNVLANILIHIESDQLVKDVILEMEEDRLAEHIHKTLKGRRYLIVMDDVWDSNVCDELVRRFPDDVNGSRILVTTRNREVAPPNCVMYALPSLSDEQCWELIQKKVFGNQPCPPKLVESGRELAASCRGMPLAAVVIAGILLNKDQEERAWEEVRRNLSSYILDGGDIPVMQILKLSYDHLPQHLKLCFLYAGVYFEEKEIPTRFMKNMWISEGFIHGENENNAAEEYLDELIDRSLIMEGKRSGGGERTCVIHDLLRELCFKTCKEEKLTRFVNSKYLGNEEDSLKVDTNSTTWMCSQYIRNRIGRRARGYQIEVPDMRLRRVLHFDCSFIYLTGTEYFVSLKYLVVTDLPPSICNLVNLEYLRVESRKWVVLSSTIMKMRKLKWVEANKGVEYHRDCDTSIINKLEFLSKVYISNAHDEDMLRCSPHLRQLKCYHAGCRMVRRPVDLSFLTQLETLHITFVKNMSWVVRLSLPSSIRNLSLAGYGSTLHPKTMSLIGGLQNLEVLMLSTFNFRGERWDTRDGEFQKLRYLTLKRMKNLRHWNVGSSQHFPKLQHLEVYLCYTLPQIPAEIGQIPTLETIEVDRSQEGSARRIQQEQRDMGNDDLRVLIRNDINWFHYLCFLPIQPSLEIRLFH